MNRQTVIVSPDIFSYLLENFFINTLETGRMSCTSQSHRIHVADSTYYELWLWKYEKKVLRDPEESNSVHYSAAQLFRFFLRRVQDRFGELAVVAGGLAVNYYLKTPSFANDIDIFVTCKEHRDIIVDMYLNSVVIPLRTTAIHSMVSLSFISAMYLDERALEEKLILVREHIGRCITTFIRLLNLQDTSNTLDVQLDTLRRTADNLPDYLSSAGHKVRESFRLSPTKTTLARPLNVIVVSIPSRRRATPFAQIICGSFDLQHCAMSLQTRTDFSFQYDFADRSQECALAHRLQLRPTCFLGPGLETPIMNQLKRIWKYIQQGYTW